MVEASYLDLFAFRDRYAPGVPIFSHGYDFPIPNGAHPVCAGPWLKPSLDFCGYDLAQGTAIVRRALTEFKNRLVALSTFYGPIAASKSALASLNDAMRLEFARLGVRVALVEPGAMKTGIFTTSRAARDAWLARAPEMERRYRPALAAFDRAFDKAGADNPRVVVEAIVRALESRRPRARVVVGKGAGALLMLARLPIGLSDRMVKNALGLTKELRPAD